MEQRETVVPQLIVFWVFFLLCPRLLPTLWLRDCLLFNIMIEGHYWTISTSPAGPEGSMPGTGTVFQSEQRTAKASRFMAFSQHVHLCSRVLVKCPSTLQAPGSGLSTPIVSSLHQTWLVSGQLRVPQCISPQLPPTAHTSKYGHPSPQLHQVLKSKTIFILCWSTDWIEGVHSAVVRVSF